MCVSFCVRISLCFSVRTHPGHTRLDIRTRLLLPNLSCPGVSRYPGVFHTGKVSAFLTIGTDLRLTLSAAEDAYFGLEPLIREAALSLHKSARVRGNRRSADVGIHVSPTRPGTFLCLVSFASRRYGARVGPGGAGTLSRCRWKNCTGAEAPCQAGALGSFHRAREPCVDPQ